jgi:hypothetical protein
MGGDKEKEKEKEKERKSVGKRTKKEEECR